jgi:hypothetical protein
VSIHYTTGVKRLVYSAKNFAVGVTVTGHIWNPSLAKSSLQTFTEVSDSIYYLDYDFSSHGMWFGKFYESGVGVISGTFNIVDTSGFGSLPIWEIIHLQSNITSSVQMASPVITVVDLKSYIR